MVEHEPALFDMTVKENLTLGLDPDKITDEQLEEAAIASNIDDEIEYFEHVIHNIFHRGSSHIH